MKEMKEMIASFVQKLRSKVGSALSKTEVECFHKSRLEEADLELLVQQTHSFPEEYQYVYRLVLAYTQNMMEVARMKGVAEEKHVHLLTFKLLRDVVNHFLSSHTMGFFEKNVPDTVEVRYHTSLHTRESVLSCTGETDQLICVGGVPVGNVVLKHISMSCNTPKEMGEILAGDKYFAERHKRCVGVEPLLFPSVLVSGQRWVFVDRIFESGREMYELSPVLVNFEVVGEGEGAVYQINQASVEMVSRMLMRMTSGMRDLIKAMRRELIRSLASEDSEGKGDDQDPPPPSAPQERPFVVDKPAATAATSTGAKRGRERGGGGEQMVKQRAT
jgi:hypothetical protein